LGNVLETPGNGGGLIDHVIRGVLQESVYVAAGELVTVASGAVVQGSVEVEGILQVSRGGVVQGSVRVGPGGEVEVAGALQGRMRVSEHATIRVDAGGSLQGKITNLGVVTVRGSVSGPVEGNELVVELGGRIVQPVTRNGKIYYEL
jgi:cytoskeletal protein CcmA (bactofilin family)